MHLTSEEQVSNKGILNAAVYSDLWVVVWYLTQKVEDGGRYDGVHSDEKVDAHVDDEGHLCVFEDTW